MPVSPSASSEPSLAALLRRPYERLSEWVYRRLALEGYGDVRPAYSSVLRNMEPGGSRVSDLATRAGLAKQSMAYLVTQMQAIDLVELAADPRDGRAKIVRLTHRGRQATSRAAVLSNSYEAHLATVVGSARAKALRTVLAEVYCLLEEENEPAESTAKARVSLRTTGRGL